MAPWHLGTLAPWHLGAFIFLAIFLLCGFIAKLFSIDNFPVHGEQQWEVVYYSAAIIELFLSIWLLTRFYIKVCLFCIVIFFIAGTLHNFYLVSLGTTSCGCFGKLEIPPIYTALIDICCAILSISLLKIFSQDRITINDPLFNPLTIGIAVFISLSFLYINAHFNITYLFNEKPLIYSIDKYVDIGTGMSGEQRIVEIRVANNTNSIVRIVGYRSSCDCIAIPEIPSQLQKNSITTIRIKYTFTGKNAFSKLVRMYVESPSMWLQTRLIGRVQHTTEPTSGS